MRVEKIVVGICLATKPAGILPDGKNLFTLPLADLAATYSPAS